jgi:hypothetical protein
MTTSYEFESHSGHSLIRTRWCATNVVSGLESVPNVTGGICAWPHSLTWPPVTNTALLLHRRSNILAVSLLAKIGRNTRGHNVL